jgi:hypothetical protein
LVLLAAATANADPERAPDCWEGAPRSDDNLDCPLPLSTGDDDDPWDDLFTLGFTVRVAYAPLKRGGLGYATRMFVARSVGFEVGMDVYGGIDADGNRHTELPLFADALLFFHRGPSVQAYLVGGGFVSFSRAQADPDQIDHQSHYGPRLGAGAQVKGARDLGWSFDVVAFQRLEIDGNATSTGALFRISGTFYVHD